MFYFKLRKTNRILKGSIWINGSKSESNRLLIIKNIYYNLINIENLSNSEDTKLVENSLKYSKTFIYINHSGTAMRFLTSYFAVKKKDVIIYGSKRIQERPLGPLVEALKNLGASIEYIKNIGYPPIKIRVKEVLGGSLYIYYCISSQYISSLMLVSSFLKTLKIFLSNKIRSEPYIYMTFKILKKLGIKAHFKDREIKKEKNNIKRALNILKNYFRVESDWSSASYYYALATFSKELYLKLSSYKYDSHQGDQVVIDIYARYFGIKTFFERNSFILYKKTTHNFPYYFKCDLNSSPDLAPTLAVNCAGLKIKCILTGLETLKSKETDRLTALQNELLKRGTITNITDNSFDILGFQTLNKYKIIIQTYEDHRMAMSFSILSMLYPISILKTVGVKKSYPSFWKNIKDLGVDIEST